MAFKSKGNEMYHLYFRKVLLVNSLQSGKAWQPYAQQTEKATRTQLCNFTPGLCT